MEIKIGDRFEAQFKTNPASEVFGDVWLPVEVTGEYKYWWSVTVLKHRNPHMCWGPSKPYPMSISRYALEHGEVWIRPLRSTKRKAG